MHTAKALVIRCMDFRFVTGLRDHLLGLGLKGQYDLVSIAGAAKNLVDPAAPTDPEFVFRHIEIARKLHHISEVVLINHLDCGAYGSVTFANADAERDRHETDLAKAKAMILERYPDLTVHTVLAGLDGDIVRAEHLN